MSDYSQITRHPLTGMYCHAEWFDDHFGPHLYGVKFPGDDVIYPADQVRGAELKTFWAADVMETAQSIYETISAGYDGWKSKDEFVLDFLEMLGVKYKERWKRDPLGGEGAVKWMEEMRGDDER